VYSVLWSGCTRCYGLHFLLGALCVSCWVQNVHVIGWSLCLLLGVHAACHCLPGVPDAGCHWRPRDLTVPALRLAFGMVTHEDAKQTEYALKIIRAHCIDVLSLFCEKDWHM
jgi:hypothetical protein